MICHVTVNTKDLQGSVDFYNKLLNLPVSRRLQTPYAEIAFLGENETKLELIQYENNSQDVVCEGISVGFYVESLNEKIGMLKTKNIEVSDVISPSPDVRFCFFTDLNGVKIQLVES